jgi:LPS-assembly lipoprotein
MKHSLLLLAASLALPSCGLQPLYSAGGSGPVAQGLSQVAVPPIAGRRGWLMRNALTDRLGASGEDRANIRYRLDVRLDDQLERFRHPLRRHRSAASGASCARAINWWM